MRDRYEQDEGPPRRRPAGGDGPRRDHDEPAFGGRSARGYYGGGRRYDDRRDDDDFEGERRWREEDWGDVQVGRWSSGRPSERDDPGGRGQDESLSGGTTGRWSRDLDADRPPGSWRGARAPARFAGVGPKGYQRSDERIREDLCDRLTADPCVDPSDVVVTVGNAEVTLEGAVDSRETKRRIEDCAEDTAGVRQVHNFLHVQGGRGPQTTRAHGGHT